jgi:staphylococcal nuclease domain-containing protein 1
VSGGGGSPEGERESHASCVAVKQGIVKQVLSGDTLVVMALKGAPPPEIQLSLSSLQAPRFARHPDATDEAFAFGSREFLRKLLIGQPVRFRVDYTKTTQGGTARSFGTVLAQDPVGDVGLRVAEAGWAKVLRSRDGKDESPDVEKLVEASAGAEAANRGVFSLERADPDMVRSVVWEVPDVEGLVKSAKKPIDAIVEHVGNGGSVRCLLRPSNVMITLNMAGLHAPRMGKRGGGASASSSEETGPEPFALPSKHFTETRVLNRDVMVELGGTDSYGNVFGQIHHPKGDIAAELLKNGLAKMNERTTKFTSREHVAMLREAERKAREARLGLWRGWSPPVVEGATKFSGTVVEVVSGDTLVVAVGEGPKAVESRISLASLKAPHFGPRDEPPQPYAAESQEALRRMAIGRPVEVHVCYTRPRAGMESDERRFATVTYVSGKGAVRSLGLQMVTDGMAEVIKHKGDEPRATDYLELLAAEDEAVAAKKGIHKGAKAAGSDLTMDLSQDLTKAKTMFPFLQRARTMTGVVQHTFGGGRCKVYVPSQRSSFMFALSGVKSPLAGRPESVGRDGRVMPERAEEPFGDAAAAWMRQTVNQRDVELIVDGCDQRGTMLGQMWMGSASGRLLVAAELLRQGLATTIPGVVDRSSSSTELLAAEEFAHSARLGVWESVVEAKEAEASAKGGEEPLVTAKCIDILDGCTFIVHATRDLESVKRVDAAMADLGAKAGSSGARVDTARGSMVAALFDDGTGPSWFRARIDGKEGEAFRVTYVDFGNQGEVKRTELRPLPPAVASVPPLARECRLAFVRARAPSEDEFGHAAAVLLSELVLEREVVMKIHSRDANNRLLVSIFREGDKESVAETMLKAGLLRVSRAAQRQVRRSGTEKEATIMEGLVHAQDEARHDRVAMWHWGDIEGTDDDER